jgi:CPA2 family monovalent cation:H+ antiporter-2
MEEFGILTDLIVVFVAAGLVVFVFHRLKIPAVVGLLVAGLIVGPYGLRLVAKVEEVNILAEVGVVVLLFTVGLEFSLSRLLAMWRVMLAIGLPQVALCVAVTAIATRWDLGGTGPAIFAGMLVAMSSTAVVLKVLTDRGELGTPAGRLAVAVLLLQDLLVTVFMLAIPLLAPQAQGGPSPLLALARGMGVVALVLVGSRWVVTPALHQVVRTRNRELFVIFVSLLCLGTAALTASVGLSLALGAFLAGLVLSESEYAHQMFAEVLPFRDTLSSLFFISVGMLLDVRFVFSHAVLIAVTVASVLTLKFLAAGLPTLLAGFPPRIAVLVGAALLQVGEFSFVLAGRGREVGLLNDEQYQTFLAAAVVTMLLTPFSIATGPALAGWLENRPVIQSRLRGRRPDETAVASLNDHVIIVGFGVGGRNLARVLLSVEIPYVILELNPEAVRRSQAQGEPIQFGDSTRPSVLEHAGIGRARVLVVVISDPAATRRTVRIARQLAPRLHIVARTRFIAEIDELRALGADEIIPEDFVTSVEIFARVLREYAVPRNQILDLIDRIRSDQYEALRGLRPARLNLLQQEIADQSELESCLVRDDAPVVGRTIRELNLRAATGATLLAVRRGGRLLTNPEADLQFQAGDTAILFGDRYQVASASALLDPTTFQGPGTEPSSPATTP